jgi:hypothetical protein
MPPFYTAYDCANHSTSGVLLQVTTSGGGNLTNIYLLQTIYFMRITLFFPLTNIENLIVLSTKALSNKFWKLSYLPANPA